MGRLLSALAAGIGLILLTGCGSDENDASTGEQQPGQQALLWMFVKTILIWFTISSILK